MFASTTASTVSSDSEDDLELLHELDGASSITNVDPNDSLYRTAQFLQKDSQSNRQMQVDFRLSYSVTNMVVKPPQVLARLWRTGLRHPETNEREVSWRAIKRVFFQRKDIIKDISGSFFPGRLSAIMGPSGAGKTSFLNILSGRLGHKRGRSIDLERKINGRTLSDSTFKGLSGYVTQEDALFPRLSPREHLIAAAWLRLPPSMSWREKLKRVDETLEVLGLTHVAKSKVGDPQSNAGLSGGERRRTSIALELLVNPKMLFLDEPTSGLDSLTAEQVVRLLKSVSQQGRTVVCTIHQPSTDVFALFDDVFLLAKGQAMYSGPRENMIPWFTSLGWPCPKYTNPSDYYMRLLAPNPELSEDEHAHVLCELAEAHHQCPQLHVPREPHTAAFRWFDVEHARFHWQFIVLLARTMMNIVRNPIASISKIISTVVMAAILSLVFLQIDRDQKGVTNFIGALFLTITFSTFPPASEAVQFFPTEKNVFFREYRNGMYSVFAYYSSLIISRFPLQLFCSVLFATLVYFPIGFDYEPDKFFVFVLLISLIYNIASSFGLVFSIPFAVETSFALLPVVFVPLLIVSGIFINLNNLPVYAYPLQYVSFIFYGFMGLSVNEFTGVEFSCSGGKGENVCEFRTGEELLEFQGMDQWTVWTAVVALVAINTFLMMLGYCCMMCVARRNSKL